MIAVELNAGPHFSLEEARTGPCHTAITGPHPFTFVVFQDGAAVFEMVQLWYLGVCFGGVLYTGVDQITTKYAGGSAHCHHNMLPRRRCFPRNTQSTASLFCKTDKILLEACS